jgi:DNA replication and repair protein RecF
VRLTRLRARGFRNIQDLDLAVPARGIVLLGANGQGKTNLLEAIYYPVFFRSFHGAGDQDIGRFGGPGFGLEVDIEDSGSRSITIRYSARKKQIDIEGVPALRLADHVGHWLAVAFLPSDLRLADGAAQERRRYLDRMLAIADRGYFVALAHYRAALAQRNAALRQGRFDLARAFDEALARAGARIVAARFAWVDQAGDSLASELATLGEPASVLLGYAGKPELTETGGWQKALEEAEPRDRIRKSTSVGPHRDDLRIELSGHSARAFGSTGQQRSIAIALKLLELGTLEKARAAPPALLLDDVFAELDRERQQRLARRLLDRTERQVFLTSPRQEELPPELDLPVWRVSQGRVTSAQAADADTG